MPSGFKPGPKSAGFGGDGAGFGKSPAVGAGLTSYGI